MIALSGWFPKNLFIAYKKQILMKHQWNRYKNLFWKDAKKPMFSYRTTLLIGLTHVSQKNLNDLTAESTLANHHLNINEGFLGGFLVILNALKDTWATRDTRRALKHQAQYKLVWLYARKLETSFLYGPYIADQVAPLSLLKVLLRAQTPACMWL